MKRRNQKYTVSEFRRAILSAGGSVKAIADELGTTRATVYAYLRQYPELQKDFDALGGSVATRDQYPLAAFEKAIQGTRGNLSAVAERMGCSRQTVYNALEKWPELNGLLRLEREALVDTAERKLWEALLNGDMQAILFTLKTQGRNRGWTPRTEISGPDGGALTFSADVTEMIRTMGLDMTEVVRQFEGFVRAAHLEKSDGHSAAG